MEQHLKQQHIQKISQNLVQQMNVLQMTTIQLNDYLTEIYLSNPLLELSEPDIPSELSHHKGQNPFDRFSADRIGGEEDYDRPDPSADASRNLEQLLLQQIDPAFSRGHRRRICLYIIGCLDQRGYFSESPECAAAQLGVSIDEVQACLDHMKTLDPPGICAKDLSECLLIQLSRRETPNLTVEKAIVQEYIELLAKNQLHAIAHQLHIPLDRVILAQERIRALNPLPGSGFFDNSPIGYIIPDIIVTREGDSLFSYVNERSIPHIYANQKYLDLFQSGSCDEETHQYLKGKLRQLNSIQEFIRIRSSTLERLGAYVVNRQREFFQRGKGFLHPLCFQEAASALQLSESTVCRAANGKYLQCDYGMFPLSYFFSRGFLLDANDTIMATEHILTVLLDIVEREDKTSPFSDRELCNQLAQRGLEISRRTIAKYREKLRIPDSRRRRVWTPSEK